jgi:hypothetical protein
VVVQGLLVAAQLIAVPATHLPSLQLSFPLHTFLSSQSASTAQLVGSEASATLPPMPIPPEPPVLIVPAPPPICDPPLPAALPPDPASPAPPPVAEASALATGSLAPNSDPHDASAMVANNPMLPAHGT